MDEQYKEQAYQLSNIGHWELDVEGEQFISLSNGDNAGLTILQIFSNSLVVGFQGLKVQKSDTMARFVFYAMMDF